MRRLLRWAFNFVAAVSWLLFVVVCVLWVRSRFATDEVLWHSQRLAPDGPAPHSRLFQLYLRSTREGLSGNWGVEWAEWHWGQLGAVWSLGQEPGDAPGWAAFVYQRPTRIAFLGARARWEWFGPQFAFSSRGLTHKWSDCSHYGEAVVPWWMLALVTAFPPALLLLTAGRRRRAKRLAAGLCPSCGYDLRATPAEPKAGGALLARCPECGHAPAGRAAP